MTEKRFKIDLDEEAITDNGEYCLSLYCFQDKGEKDVCDLLNDLNEENEELKQRNNRQAKQLDRLYNLIEEKDWRTLTDIIDDFKRCEEQLQREWKCYE